jgi:hypothetical protein
MAPCISQTPKPLLTSIFSKVPYLSIKELNIKAVLTAAKGKKIDISQSKILKYLYLEI